MYLKTLSCVYRINVYLIVNFNCKFKGILFLDLNNLRVREQKYKYKLTIVTKTWFGQAYNQVTFYIIR